MSFTAKRDARVSLARERYLDHFRRGSPSCEAMLQLLKERMPRVKGSKRDYHLFDTPTLYGHARFAYDANERALLVVYEKLRDQKRLSYRRNKDEYRVPTKPVFLPLPEAWAWLNGHVGELDSKEFGAWGRKLLDATRARMDVLDLDDQRANWRIRYELPAVCDPNVPLPAIEDDDPEYETKVRRQHESELLWKAMRWGRHRKLRSDFAQVVFAVWCVLEEKWDASALASSRGLPRPVMLTDGYLVQALARKGIKSSERAVGRALEELIRYDFAQVTHLVQPITKGAKCAYRYYPGLGLSLDESFHAALTTRQALEVKRSDGLLGSERERVALGRMRRYALRQRYGEQGQLAYMRTWLLRRKQEKAEQQPQERRSSRPRIRNRAVEIAGQRR